MKLRNPIPLLLMSAACLVAAVVSASEPDTIPAGTNLDIRLKTKVSTKHNRSGDLFTGEVEHAVLSGNVEIIPAGSTVNGHLEKVRPAGHDHRAGMRPVIDTIAGRSGMLYKLSPEIQRLTVVRSSGYKPGDTAPGGGGPAAQGAKQAPRFPQGADLPPGTLVLLVARYQEGVLYPGAELTFLLKQPVAATKPSTGE